MRTLAELLKPEEAINKAVNAAINGAATNISDVLRTIAAQPQATAAVVGVAVAAAVVANYLENHRLERQGQQLAQLEAASNTMAQAIVQEVPLEFQSCASLMFSTELVVRKGTGDAQTVCYTAEAKAEDFDLSKGGHFGGGEIGKHLRAFASKFESYFLIRTGDVKVPMGGVLADLAVRFGNPDPIKLLIAKFAINTARMMSNSKLIDHEIGVYFLKALYVGFVNLANQPFMQMTHATQNGLVDFIRQAIEDLRQAWLDALCIDYNRASSEYLSQMRDEYIKISRDLPQCIYALMAKEVVREPQFDRLEEKTANGCNTAWGTIRGTALQAILYRTFTTTPTPVVAAANSDPREVRVLRFIQALEQDDPGSAPQSAFSNFIMHCNNLDIQNNGTVAYRTRNNVLMTLASGFSEDIIHYIHAGKDQKEKQRRKAQILTPLLQILKTGRACQVLLFAQEEAHKFAKKYGDQGIYELYGDANHVLKLFTNTHASFFKQIIDGDLALLRSGSLHDVIATTIPKQKQLSPPTRRNLQKADGYFNQLKTNLKLVAGRAGKMAQAFARWSLEQGQNDSNFDTDRQEFLLKMEGIVSQLNQMGIEVHREQLQRPVTINIPAPAPHQQRDQSAAPAAAGAAAPAAAPAPAVVQPEVPLAAAQQQVQTDIFSEDVTKTYYFSISCKKWPDHALYVPSYSEAGWINCWYEGLDPGDSGHFELQPHVKEVNGKITTFFTIISRQHREYPLHVCNDWLGGLVSRYKVPAGTNFDFDHQNEFIFTPQDITDPKTGKTDRYYLMGSLKWPTYKLYVSKDGRVKSDDCGVSGGCKDCKGGQCICLDEKRVNQLGEGGLFIFKAWPKKPVLDSVTAAAPAPAAQQEPQDVPRAMPVLASNNGPGVFADRARAAAASRPVSVGADNSVRLTVSG